MSCRGCIQKSVTVDLLQADIQQLKQRVAQLEGDRGNLIEDGTRLGGRILELTNEEAKKDEVIAKLQWDGGRLCQEILRLQKVESQNEAELTNLRKENKLLRCDATKLATALKYHGREMEALRDLLDKEKWDYESQITTLEQVIMRMEADGYKHIDYDDDPCSLSTKPRRPNNAFATIMKHFNQQVREFLKGDGFSQQAEGALNKPITETYNVKQDLVLSLIQALNDNKIDYGGKEDATLLLEKLEAYDDILWQLYIELFRRMFNYGFELREKKKVPPLPFILIPFANSMVPNTPIPSWKECKPLAKLPLRKVRDYMFQKTVNLRGHEIPNVFHSTSINVRDDLLPQGEGCVSYAEFYQEN